MKSQSYIQHIFDEKKDFIIIATTGKARSNVTDVCNLLVSKDLPDNATQPADTSQFEDSEIREFKVVYRYLHHNWKPFIEINVTNVMLSYLLETDIGQLKNEKIESINKSLYDLLNDALNRNIEINIENRLIDINKRLRYGQQNEDTCRKNILHVCKSLLSTINLSDRVCALQKLIINNQYGEINATTQLEYFCIYYGILPEINGYFEKILKDTGLYTQLFQNIGNNIRAYGKAVYSNNSIINEKSIFAIPERIKYFIKLLRRYETNMEKSFNNISENQSEEKETKIYVVINNLKNIFEAYYFRCRYSSFYLLSISCDEKMRQRNFNDNTTYLLTELKENLSLGKKVFRRVDKYVSEHDEAKNWFLNNQKYNNIKDKVKTVIFSEAEYLFMQQIYTEKSELRKECYKNDLANIILQDVNTCIENADIFLTRNLQEKEYRCDYGLIRPLARIVALMMHPGLLTPTKIEQCMQVAMTAKLNSGCLSRQVGAVVTDSRYNILSLGWNDTPCGVESCIRRNMYDLIRNHDDKAYSEFELYDETFRDYIKKVSEIAGTDEMKRGLRGLPYAFCFKDIYQDIIHQRDQIYTKSLHAEERALAICGNERTKGGYLFTTSSPCELCAKKAKEGEISKIYYIEQYPGISRTHILNAGSRETWAEYIPFVGAIGLAYIKLYTPIMPYKDEIKALGYAPVDFYHKSIQNESNTDNISTTNSVYVASLETRGFGFQQEQQEMQI
ncbi:MAG: hypothetical protein MR936_08155 [Eubacterium sp.]|nr:hypothetical protein [Eubacterium sp.]